MSSDEIYCPVRLWVTFCIFSCLFKVKDTAPERAWSFSPALQPLGLLNNLCPSWRGWAEPWLSDKGPAGVASPLRHFKWTGLASMSPSQLLDPPFLLRTLGRASEWILTWRFPLRNPSSKPKRCLSPTSIVWVRLAGPTSGLPEGKRASCSFPFPWD